MSITYTSESDILKDSQRIDQLFNEIHTSHKTIQSTRQSLLDKMTKSINKLDPYDETDKASMIMAKTGVINTYRELLKDMEDSTLKIVNTHMKHKEVKTHENISKDVIDFLQELQKQPHDIVPINRQSADNQLSKQILDQSIKVSSTELKDSPYDFD
jgi:hypothetical protein